MASLRVQALASGGLKDFTITIGGRKVDLANGQGCIEVDGNCGSGGPQIVRWELFGPAGETLSFTIDCEGNIVLGVREAKIPSGAESCDSGQVELKI